jgi:hypothetical protein
MNVSYANKLFYKTNLSDLHQFSKFFLIHISESLKSQLRRLFEKEEFFIADLEKDWTTHLVFQIDSHAKAYFGVVLTFICTLGNLRIFM